MDRRLGTELSAKDFDSPIANDLIDIHIRLRARAGLPDDQLKMLV